jgi:hypothetical protein
VVVDVGLAEMLPLLVFVGFVVVRDRRVVVFMAVVGQEVGDVLPVTAVMGHVAVLMLMNRRFV